MAKFIIVQPGKPDMWVKEVDKVNKTISFTTDPDEAVYEREGGWFAEAEANYMKFHFKDKHPEIMFVKPDRDW